MRRYEQLSLLLGDLIATHHTNYNGDGKPGFGIICRNASPSTTGMLRPLRLECFALCDWNASPSATGINPSLAQPSKRIAP
ncbi:MAG: hypothetical protein HC789_01350 [Microcoleus sp. CSU_2_2]|nr:hypothetical protein [Microcoleus sp. CSU_2_2]